MTLNELKALDKEYLTPADVAPLMNCDPQHIRIQAHKDKSKLGFPVVLMGTKTIIPRQGFIKFWEGS